MAGNFVRSPKVALWNMVRAADRRELFPKVLNKAGLRFQTAACCFLCHFVGVRVLMARAIECCGCSRALLWFCACSAAGQQQNSVLISAIWSARAESKTARSDGSRAGQEPWGRAGLCVLGAAEVGWAAAGRCAGRLCLRVLLLSAFPLKPAK